jgi:hypothetical protein
MQEQGLVGEIYRGTLGPSETYVAIPEQHLPPGKSGKRGAIQTQSTRKGHGENLGMTHRATTQSTSFSEAALRPETMHRGPTVRTQEILGDTSYTIPA